MRSSPLSSSPAFGMASLRLLTTTPERQFRKKASERNGVELTTLVCHMFRHSHSPELNGFGDVPFPRPYTTVRERLEKPGLSKNNLVCRRLCEVLEQSDATMFQLDVRLGFKQWDEVRGERDRWCEEGDAM